MMNKKFNSGKGISISGWNPGSRTSGPRYSLEGPRRYSDRRSSTPGFDLAFIKNFKVRSVAVLLSLLLFANLATLPAQKNPLDSIIAAHPEWGEWTQNPEKYQVQVRLTEFVTEGRHGLFTYYDYDWGCAPGEYFYPASTVKLPVAALALEWLNDQGIENLDADSFFTTGKGRKPQSERTTTADTEHGFPTIANDIRKIFLVSDNDAYNRLFELLGQERITRRLREMGLKESRILHRVGVSGFGPEDNQYCNPVHFHYPDKTLYQRAERHSVWREEVIPWADRLRLNGEQRGVGYTLGDKLIMQPFDFSQKNYLSLENLHRLMFMLVEPGFFSHERNFRLNDDGFDLLRAAMSTLPRQSNYPAYVDKPDNYVKFWLFGDRSKDYRIPDHITSYNKVGLAYGYLTDVAFIKDAKSGKQYLISGTIHVNENQIYNDGVYEYEKIGFPFFGKLGRAVHEYITGEKL
ncbi:hypothetical protein CEQ90_16915 [Lewinellaceae bacterium SD302]|nr:hypothetical protein CEQ90_16915 [Lewinellaceae bacterium SD302]